MTSLHRVEDVSRRGAKTQRVLIKLNDDCYYDRTSMAYTFTDSPRSPRLCVKSF